MLKVLIILSIFLIIGSDYPYLYFPNLLIDKEIFLLVLKVAFIENHLTSLLYFIKKESIILLLDRNM